MSMSRIVSAAGAAVLFALPVLAEDLTIVYKTTGQGGPGTSTSYYSSEKMRTSDAERDTIIEYGAGRIVSVDHKKKEYSEITLAEMEAAMKAAAAKMQEATAQMQQQMANMPPAMREKMEAMMGGGAGAVTVTKGAVRKVAGYDCQNYDVKMANTMDMVVCASTAIKPPAPNVDPSKYASVAGPAAAFAANPMFKGMAKLAEEMKKIQGFSLAESSSLKMMGRNFESAKEATEVKTGPIPASAFDVPSITKGYKKVENPVLKMAK
jgi:hypothetical protein